MRCYLDLSDVEAASKAWDAMSTPGREHFIGRYLYYCLALRRGDDAGGEHTRSELESKLIICSEVRIKFTGDGA